MASDVMSLLCRAAKARRLAEGLREEDARMLRALADECEQAALWTETQAGVMPPHHFPQIRAQ
jgi:hypothetical protein